MSALSDFSLECDRVFADPIVGFGFAPTGEQWVEDWSVSRIYGAASQYVEVFVVNLYFRDERPHCGIYLGEGNSEWPETDWNKIALCALKMAEGEPIVEYRDRYPFESLGEIPKVLRTICEDLLVEGVDFLCGSMAFFREIRSRINRQREPYKCYSPDPTGQYSMRIDEQSAELKRRFS